LIAYGQAQYPVFLQRIIYTIHKVDECVSTDDLIALADIYEQILEQLLT